MRISDWSSTCALPIFYNLREVVGNAGEQLADRRRTEALRPVATDQQVLERFPLHAELAAGGAGDAVVVGAAGGQADRQSVVEGRRVSVRVDLGGRRIIQKKNYNNTSQVKTNKE